MTQLEPVITSPLNRLNLRCAALAQGATRGSTGRKLPVRARRQVWLARGSLDKKGPLECGLQAVRPKNEAARARFTYGEGVLRRGSAAASLRSEGRLGESIRLGCFGHQFQSCVSHEICDPEGTFCRGRQIIRRQVRLSGASNQDYFPVQCRGGRKSSDRFTGPKPTYAVQNNYFLSNSLVVRSS